MSEKMLLIAGGGLGGLSAALALLKRGFKVRVLEQAPEIKEVGAGIQLGPNGTRVLFDLGLREALFACCYEVRRKEIRVWDSGDRYQFVSTGESAMSKYGAPYVTVHRADLQDILLQAIRRIDPEAVQVGAKVERVEQSGAEVRATLADGRTLTGSAFIGADGLHSATRRQLFGDTRAEFTGGVAWRGLVPAENVSSEFSRTVGTTWIGLHGHVVTYPVRRGELINVVGHIERDDWRVESWTERGEKAEFLQDFAGWHPDVIELIANIEEPFKWALFLRKPLLVWTVGRCALLGDACHPTLPYLAQGANMAIEDGLVLARCIEAYDDVETALKRYEAARAERGAAIVHGSAANLARFHNPRLSNPETARDYVMEEWNPQTIAERYDWIYSYDAVNTPV